MIALVLTLGLALQEPPAESAPPVTGLVPLIDLTEGEYRGHAGGLYPGGASRPPEAHLAAALEAARLVHPLDATGAVDTAGGLIGFVAVGMSTTAHAFGRFERELDLDPRRNPRLVLVNGADAGATTETLVEPDGPSWAVIDARVAALGLTPEQVQVVWLQQRRAPVFHRRMAALEEARRKREAGEATEPEVEPERTGADKPRRGGRKAGQKQITYELSETDFPARAERLSGDLERIVGHLRHRYPNLRLCFLSDRLYAFYSDRGSGEPGAYEAGFAVKWLIERQLTGAAELAEAPPLLWGPFLWADGTEPNGLGIRWERDDFEADGLHPSEAGERKLAGVLTDFFGRDPAATPWFLRGETDGPGPLIVFEPDRDGFGSRSAAAAGRAGALKERSQELEVGGRDQAVVWLRFDLPELPRPVLHARLSLRNSTRRGAHDELAVHVVERFGALPAEGAAAVALPSSSRDASRALDLTEVVNATEGRLLTLALTAEGGARLLSAESAAPPRLVVVPR